MRLMLLLLLLLLLLVTMMVAHGDCWQQDHRPRVQPPPVRQTPVQMAVYESAAMTAKNASNAATPTLLLYLNSSTFRSGG